jgi:hypothetical protein
MLWHLQKAGLPATINRPNSLNYSCFLPPESSTSDSGSLGVFALNLPADVQTVADLLSQIESFPHFHQQLSLLP